MITKISRVTCMAALLLSSAAFAADRGEHEGRGFGDDRGGGRGHMGVPELNAKTAGVALALVLGGVAVVLGRRKRSTAGK